MRYKRIKYENGPPEEKKQWDISIVSDQFREVLGLARNSKTNKDLARRDYMVLMIMGNMGLRVGEAAILDRETFEGIDRKIPIAYPKTLKKRGDKPPRMPIYVHPEPAGVISEYLSVHMYKSQEYLFVGGQDGHISGRHIRRIFDTYSDILPENYSSHSIRHMYLTMLWECTNDQAFVRDQARHATIGKSMGTTNSYIHLSEKRAVELIDKIEVFV